MPCAVAPAPWGPAVLRVHYSWFTVPWWLFEPGPGVALGRLGPELYRGLDAACLAAMTGAVCRFTGAAVEALKAPALHILSRAYVWHIVSTPRQPPAVSLKPLTAPGYYCSYSTTKQTSN